MTVTLSPAVSRLAALLLTAAVGLALWLIIARPITAHLADSRDTLARERQLLGRLISGGNRQLTASDLERRVAELLGGETMLKGESEAIRLAGLQTLVGELAARGNLRLRSVRPLPRREQGGLVVLGVRIQTVTDIAGVQGLIHRLETADTLLFLTGVQMTRTGAGGDGAAEIDLRLDVLGLARREGG